MTEMLDWLLNSDENATAPENARLYARYLTEGALLQTLAGHELRMQTFKKMNDPREVRQWVAQFTNPGHGGDVTSEVQNRVDQVLQQSARVMSFTADREPATEAERPHLLHRSWARSGMWNRYAGDHYGACLILDVDEVSYLVGQQPALGQLRFRASGPVDYRDTPMHLQIPSRVTTADELDDSLEAMLGGDSGSDCWSNTVLEHLYFEKNRSWTDETEWRIVTVDTRPETETIGKPQYVPMANSLKAIIFGEEYARPEITAAAVTRFCGRAGAEPPVMLHCKWAMGTPRLDVIEAAVSGEYDLYWKGRHSVPEPGDERIWGLSKPSPKG